MNWKRFWIVIASAALLTGAVRLVMACAEGPDPYDAYPSFFLNDVTDKPAYQPFYYTDLLTYYDQYDLYEPPKMKEEPDENIAEWQQYCNKAATEQDISRLVYRFSIADLRSIAEHIGKRKVSPMPDSVAGNTFAQWLAKNREGEVLNYLMFAKKCEPYTVPLESYWDDEAGKYTMPLRDTVAMGKLVDEGRELYRKAKKDNIRLRYAYQVLRMAFYSSRYDETLQLYAGMVGDKGSSSIIYPRCMGLEAGALYRLGKKTEAAYLYSKVFDRSDEMRESVFTSFNWAVGADAEKVLPLCKTAHERAVLYIMDGLYQSEGQEMEGLGLLQKAYAADPKVSGLDVVMVRELNKAEQNYLAEKYAISNVISFVDQALYAPAETPADELQDKMNRYSGYLDSLDRFAQNVATGEQRGDRAFWILASSYIAYMRGNMPACRQALGMVSHEPMTDREKDLGAVINALCIAGNKGKIDVQTEAELLPSLKWIEERAKDEPRFAKVYRDMMTAVLGSAYLKQGDSMRAVFCFSREANSKEQQVYTGDYTYNTAGQLLESMGPERINALERYIEQSNKSPFEQWLVKDNCFTVRVLQELEGTKYIRRLNFDKAVQVFRMLPEEDLKATVLPDPFIMHIDDQHDLRKIDTAITMNKLQFAQKMAAQKSRLEKDPKDAEAAYLYAAGLYNMSYYGRANHAFVYFRSGVDPNAYFYNPARDKLPAFYKEYYDPAEAERYFLIAAQYDKDPEQRAKCTYMAAKCWQKRCPPPKNEYYYYGGDDSSYVAYSWQNPYFGKLKNEYAKTNFYKIAFNTCTYFSSYVKKVK
jgi:hypothetical protein